ncbi:RNA methyltransferase [Algoriphagus lacus]|uniref:RNA methyltransferase n=1 Tax=Algoriphagus lacus TaxID=2056311 RepID=A0A418PNF7_9BACT|nr:RNA methyltransferase [Algoriphagus lacus]RIW13379.1 RNA methyltransferase [Algoriphagus lacus]
MAYNATLANGVRIYLAELEGIAVVEKEMFAVLNFLVNGKTGICVSGDRLMLRFDPALPESLSLREGYETMLMKRKECYKGYCYFNSRGYRNKPDFDYLLAVFLNFNKVSRKSNSKNRTGKGIKKEVN